MWDPFRVLGVGAGSRWSSLRSDHRLLAAKPPASFADRWPDARRAFPFQRASVIRQPVVAVLRAARASQTPPPAHGGVRRPRKSITRAGCSRSIQYARARQPPGTADGHVGAKHSPSRSLVQDSPATTPIQVTGGHNRPPTRVNGTGRGGRRSLHRDCPPPAFRKQGSPGRAWFAPPGLPHSASCAVGFTAPQARTPARGAVAPRTSPCCCRGGTCAPWRSAPAR